MLEGGIRVGLLVAYLALIGCFGSSGACSSTTRPSTRRSTPTRTAPPLEPEVVQRYSLIHLRCGTAFLLWVMVIAILVFSLPGGGRR